MAKAASPKGLWVVIAPLLLPKLDFGHSCGVAEGIDQSAANGSGVLFGRVGAVMLLTPLAPGRTLYGGQGIGEGRAWFGYHAAPAIRRRWRAGSCAANSVTIENRASRQCVVRAMALSDHCRCVSTPRWARASWKVTSTVQRRTNHPTICAGSRVRSVQSRAWGGRRASGSRMSTHRIGTTGRPPCRHTAVSEAISIVRAPARTSRAPRPCARACPSPRGARRAWAAVRLWCADARSCRAVAAVRDRRGLRRAAGG